MLQYEHQKRMVDACYPESREQALLLWNNIRPVRFGDRLAWANSVNRQTLAFYEIPEDASYLAIMRTECYTYTEVAAAPGFRNFEPPPAGNLQWFINTGGTAIEPITGLVPTHLLADVDEVIYVKSGVPVSLEGVLSAPPDANARFIRTTVYAYLLGTLIADYIAGHESLAFGRNT